VEYLAQLRSRSLEQQKNRLATYQVQARFALATMYDRAANTDATHTEQSAPVQQGSDVNGTASGAEAMRRPIAAAMAPRDGGLPAAERLATRGRADSGSQRTIKDLESHPVAVRKDSRGRRERRQAMENYRRFLELQKTDPQLRAASVATARRSSIWTRARSSAWKRRSRPSICRAGSHQAVFDTAAGLSRLRRNDQCFIIGAPVRDDRPARAGTRHAWIASCSAYPAARNSMKCSSGVASCSFPRNVMRSGAGLRGSSSSVQSFRVLRAGLYKHGWSLFKTVAHRGEPALVRRACWIRSSSARNGKVPRLEDLKRADREAGRKTRCGV